MGEEKLSKENLIGVAIVNVILLSVAVMLLSVPACMQRNADSTLSDFPPPDNEELYLNPGQQSSTNEPNWVADRGHYEYFNEDKFDGNFECGGAVHKFDEGRIVEFEVRFVDVKEKENYVNTQKCKNSAVEEKYEFMQGCGATLVSPVHSVTAAHCVSTYQRNRNIIYGTQHTWKRDEQIRLKVLYVRYHPLYNPVKMFYDIALLTHPKIEFSAITSPACLPLRAYPCSTTHMWVAGWGKQETYLKPPDYLLQVKVPLTKCTESPHTLDLCAAEPEGGKDACQGDSGGPFGMNINNKFYLFGVVSWGRGCAFKGNPGYYARVDTVMNWLCCWLKDLKECQNIECNPTGEYAYPPYAPGQKRLAPPKEEVAECECDDVWNTAPSFGGGSSSGGTGTNTNATDSNTGDISPATGRTDTNTGGFSPATGTSSNFAYRSASGSKKCIGVTQGGTGESIGASGSGTSTGGTGTSTGGTGTSTGGSGTSTGGSGTTTGGTGTSTGGTGTSTGGTGTSTGGTGTSTGGTGTTTGGTGTSTGGTGTSTGGTGTSTGGTGTSTGGTGTSTGGTGTSTGGTGTSTGGTGTSTGGTGTSTGGTGTSTGGTGTSTGGSGTGGNGLYPDAGGSTGGGIYPGAVTTTAPTPTTSSPSTPSPWGGYGYKPPPAPEPGNGVVQIDNEGNIIGGTPATWVTETGEKKNEFGLCIGEPVKIHTGWNVDGTRNPDEEEGKQTYKPAYQNPSKRSIRTILRKTLSTNSVRRIVGPKHRTKREHKPDSPKCPCGQMDQEYFEFLKKVDKAHYNQLYWNHNWPKVNEKICDLI